MPHLATNDGGPNCLFAVHNQAPGGVNTGTGGEPILEEAGEAAEAAAINAASAEKRGL
jgi:hypothetical protein